MSWDGSRVSACQRIPGRVSHGVGSSRRCQGDLPIERNETKSGRWGCAVGKGKAGGTEEGDAVVWTCFLVVFVHCWLYLVGHLSLRAVLMLMVFYQ